MVISMRQTAVRITEFFEVGKATASTLVGVLNL